MTRQGAVLSSAAATRSPYTIQVVNDRPDSAESTRNLLKGKGHTVLCATTGREALNLLSQHKIHLMVIDYLLPDMTGIELIEECRRMNDLVQIVLQTGHGNSRPPRDLLRTLAIQGYHDESDGPEKLLQTVDIACRAQSVLERSRRSEHLKSQLVANVSHELRTPLNVILGYIELMREGACGPQTPEATEAIVTINRQGLILLHLINDLLDMSKLQAGAMQVTRERVCVAEVVDEFRNVLPILVGGAPIRLSWNVPSGTQAVGDPGKVRVVVQNLISNAAKFTRKGEIETSVRALPEHVLISVRDTGPGVDPRFQDRIFELFEQAEPHDPCRQGGTGIGLYLARALSRLMGGDLTVKSTVGKGSTFTLRLAATL